MKKEKSSDLVSNRKAFHNYEILESFEAGMVLLGSEIKSLRAGGGSLQEAYIKCKSGALWLVNASIAPYAYGGIHFNHEERRERKLLMHNHEIKYLTKQIQEKGWSLVALALYLKRGRVKIKLALARGKKQFDKRKAIKEREEKRAISRALRQQGT